MDQRPLCSRPCLHPECSARRRAALAKPPKAAASSPDSVTQTQTLSNAARQARWRKAHPKKHAETQKARWARRKTSGKTQEAR